MIADEDTLGYYVWGWTGRTPFVQHHVILNKRGAGYELRGYRTNSTATVQDGVPYFVVTAIPTIRDARNVLTTMHGDITHECIQSLTDFINNQRENSVEKSPAKKPKPAPVPKRRLRIRPQTK